MIILPVTVGLLVSSSLISLFIYSKLKRHALGDHALEKLRIFKRALLAVVIAALLSNIAWAFQNMLWGLIITILGLTGVAAFFNNLRDLQKSKLFKFSTTDQGSIFLWVAWLSLIILVIVYLINYIILWIS